MTTDDTAINEELGQRLRKAGVWVRHSAYSQPEPDGYVRDAAPFEAADALDMQRRQIDHLLAEALKTERTELRLSHGTVRQLLARAKLDTDPISLFQNGTCWQDSDACILVVKGSERARAVYEMLLRQGLITAPRR